jgi:MoxR-like ATPase
MVGTYPLPEAQMDRFFARASLGYPSPEVEAQILESRQLHTPLEHLQPVLSPDQLLVLQRQTRRLYVGSSVRRYIVDVVNATRRHPKVMLGASPRASIALMQGAQAHALLAGRHYTTPDDVQQMAVPVLAHRLMLRSDAASPARAEGVVQEILSQVPVPIGGDAP